MHEIHESFCVKALCKHLGMHCFRMSSPLFNISYYNGSSSLDLPSNAQCGVATCLCTTSVHFIRGAYLCGPRAVHAHMHLHARTPSVTLPFCCPGWTIKCSQIVRCCCNDILPCASLLLHLFSTAQTRYPSGSAPNRRWVEW